MFKNLIRVTMGLFGVIIYYSPVHSQTLTDLSGVKILDDTLYVVSNSTINSGKIFKSTDYDQTFPIGPLIVDNLQGEEYLSRENDDLESLDILEGKVYLLSERTPKEENGPPKLYLDKKTVHNYLLLTHDGVSIGNNENQGLEGLSVRRNTSNVMQIALSLEGGANAPIIIVYDLTENLWNDGEIILKNNNVTAQTFPVHDVYRNNGIDEKCKLRIPEISWHNDTELLAIVSFHQCHETKLLCRFTIDYEEINCFNFSDEMNEDWRLMNWEGFDRILNENRILLVADTETDPANAFYVIEVPDDFLE